jgi:glycosyltransferase involved in cell wall biosynthesis
MTKILLLTQWFEPEPTFKGLTFAKELKRQGFEVEVVTGFPNYPGGKVYSGYHIKWFQREVLDGIIVNRVPLYPSHDRSAVRRIMNYVSFAFTSLIYVIFFTRRVDVIYAYHPPLTIGFVAALYKLIRRNRMVLDVQDLWPDTLRATGMIKNKYALSIIDKIAKLIYRVSDKIVVLSEGFNNRLVNRGVPEEKVEIIKNWADEDKLNLTTEVNQFTIEDSKYFNILFAGNIGKAQALHSIIDAAEILVKQNSSVLFIFLGRGLEVENLKEIIKSRNLNNVLFLPAVEMEKVGKFLRAADALLVHLRDDELFEITIPSKVQAYMAIGKPILMAVKGDAANLVYEAKCGVFAEPENPVSLANAALRLESMTKDELQIMGGNGKEFYSRELSMEVGVSKFTKVFKEIRRC